jgi:diguanylate cyclase (GGDEF)-like protein
VSTASERGRLRHGRRSSEVRLLTAMASVGALRGVLTAIAPPNNSAPTGIYLAVAALAASMGLMVWFLPWRWCQHLALGTGVAILTSVVSFAHAIGATGASIGYVWITLYAAFFFERRTARVYVVAATTCFMVALALNPFPGSIAIGVPLVLTIIVVSEATNRLVHALHRAATTDALTGLLNRHGLFTATEHTLAQAERSGRPLAVLIIDLDGFKQINDDQGHAAGDRILEELARAWTPHLRRSDIVARFGGDEFVMVLPDTDATACVEMAQRLRNCSPIAWSYGLAVAGGGRSLDELLADADADLYRAKTLRQKLPKQRHTAAELSPS